MALLLLLLLLLLISGILIGEFVLVWAEDEMSADLKSYSSVTELIEEESCVTGDSEAKKVFSWTAKPVGWWLWLEEKAEFFLFTEYDV